MKFVAATLCALLPLTAAQAENSVVVDSRTVRAGATGVEVGIWLKNEVPLTGLVIPLEFRDTDGNGSYATSVPLFKPPTSHRLWTSPLCSVTKRILGVPRTGNSCSGPISSSYSTNTPFDGVSPDGFLYAAVGCGGPPQLDYLLPGDDRVRGVHPNWPLNDSTPYEAGPSLTFRFNVNTVPGTFEIDTCCVTPAVHLGAADLNVSLVTFTFTMGVITIVDPNLCLCPCHGDPNCDGVWDIRDVVAAVNVAYRGAPADHPTCPYEDTDVNCSGWTDIFDVAKIVDVAFRASDPATEFCLPCPP